MQPEFNIFAIIVAALVPSILGFIYYNLIFKNAWLDSLGKTEEEMQPANPAIAYPLALVMAFIVSGTMKMVIESLHKEVNDAGELVFGSFHTFGHGALHGALLAIFLVIPIIVSLSIFQKNSFKNILLNVFFWLICFTLMGGILDAWN